MASYDWQDYGGDIRPRLHTEISPSWQMNPLKITLGVPAREHLVEQLSFSVVTQTAHVVAITEVRQTVA
jgi:hypothetical protein